MLQNLLANLIDSFYLKFIARSFVIAAPYTSFWFPLENFGTHLFQWIKFWNIPGHSGEERSVFGDVY